MWCLPWKLQPLMILFIRFWLFVFLLIMTPLTHLPPLVVLIRRFTLAGLPLNILFIRLMLMGLFRKSTSVVAYCGLIRDHIGRFIKGFSSNLGFCNAIYVELWGLYKGIILARDLSLSHVHFKMDSLLVVHLVTMNKTQSNLL